MASDLSIPRLGAGHASRLTKRWSEPLAAVMRTFDFMKQFSSLPRSLPPAVAQLCLVRPSIESICVEFGLAI